MKPFLPGRLYAFFLSLLLITFTACEEDVDKPTNNPPAGEANVVTGVVQDTKGQPMAGVKVRAVNTASGGNTFVDATTDNNGRYTLKTSFLGGWTMVAWKTVTTPDGDTYHLRIAGATDADYEPFTPGENAIIRNFKWKLSGVIPDRPQAADFSTGYFGGSLRFVNDHYRDNSDAVTEMPVGTVITVTLTPVNGAKYLDGSPATQVITKSFTIAARTPRNVNYYIGDIPVTAYSVTAKTSTGANVYLGRDEFNYDDHLANAAAVFFPEGLSMGSYESGVGVGAASNFPYFMSKR